MRRKAVVVGCGGMGGAWLRLLKTFDEVEICALVDIREEAAREKAEQFGLDDVAVGTDLAAILEATTPDFVVDCTVPEAHAAVTLEALGRGCHVLGEKPLADSMENARKMTAAAREAGRIYAVAQQRRYNPQIRRLRRFIESGVIGPLTTVDCDFYIGAHFGGFRAQMDHVLLLDMAIHTFDASRLISGADPLAVQCHEWNPAGSWFRHGASAVAIFEMTGEVVFTYRGSWCSEGLNTPWESHWRVTGRKGSVSWDGAQGFKAQVAGESRKGLFAELHDVETPPIDADQPPDDRRGLFLDFLQALESGGEPETVCTDNIKSLAMVFGAIESAEAGRRVEIVA
jgi:predicted dehydrogenase